MNLINNDLQVRNRGNNQAQIVSNQQATQFANNLASAQQTIKVQSGDTVSELAEKYQTTTAAIVQENNLQDPDFILTGQSLVLPSQFQTSTSVTEITEATKAAKATEVLNETTANTISAIGTTSPSDDETVEPTLAGTEKEARDYIIQHESGDNYQARNGRYIGKYQLDQSYLNGDFSPANQEKVAAEYVQQRYGTWANAKQHWIQNNWY